MEEKDPAKILASIIGAFSEHSSGLDQIEERIEGKTLDEKIDYLKRISQRIEKGKLVGGAIKGSVYMLLGEAYGERFSKYSKAADLNESMKYQSMFSNISESELSNWQKRME
ncbi:hypothetical protein ACFLZZ_02305 [Nanoarchaeota archaeon]